jgi:hypothetical protein
LRTAEFFYAEKQTLPPGANPSTAAIESSSQHGKNHGKNQIYGGIFSVKKSKWFMTGTLGLMLAFGLVLAGCDQGNGGGGNSRGSEISKLLGTWVKTGGSAVKLVFADDGEYTTLEIWMGEKNLVVDELVESYDGTTLTLQRMTLDIALDGDVLTISGVPPGGESFIGSYTRQ